MLEILRPDRFDQIFSLMEESFPTDEYRTYEEQKALLDNAAYKIYHAGGGPSCPQMMAFIAVWQFDGFAYIEHFAVDPAYRSQGLGAQILHEMDGLLSGPICLEVELPETALAKRRIAFYQRNGFFLNDYPYVQPPLSQGKRPLPLMLMTSGRCVAPDRFEAIRKTLYREVYHAAAPIRPDT